MLEIELLPAELEIIQEKYDEGHVTFRQVRRAEGYIEHAVSRIGGALYSNTYSRFYDREALDESTGIEEN